MALSSNVKPIANTQYLVERLDGIDGSAMQSAAQAIVDKLGHATAVILGGLPDPSDQQKVILVNPL